jgi:two-component sensor histidine kinase
VTALRHRDRELITKDATIREIHHRVKNNLQTVAALLRLQARWIDGPEATAALEEAVRRVGSIAIVHETLSQAVEETVDFDDVVDRLSRLVTDVGSLAGAIRVRREGSFGKLDAEQATPLAMVITELLQNAVEHGYGEPGDPTEGLIVIRADRRPSSLAVVIDDDGHGLPDGFDVDAADSLGLTIVRTLVESELRGRLTLGKSPDGGTRADLTISLD